MVRPHAQVSSGFSPWPRPASLPCWGLTPSV
jgi:hypothetical protein